MNYIDPANGVTYPTDTARWCSDTGGYLNLGPSAGLKRGDIDTSRHSVWRYAKAIGVDDKHAVTMGEGWTPLIRGEWLGGQQRAQVMFKLEFMNS
jgi:threonine synthase